MSLEHRRHIDLETLVAPWPIASALSSHLSAGDLVTLSRTSTGLRAALHGFPPPLPTESPYTSLGTAQVSKHTVRPSLHIGSHDTPYWTRLKSCAQFTCSSPTHTRGDKTRPCLFCSKPICEACIVRSSFARGKENTFNNRVRHFCSLCWHEGTIPKSRRFPLSCSVHSTWYKGDENCNCTLKDNGWLCLECKDRQNAEATNSEAMICHGEGCKSPVGDHSERRRCCLWCQKTLPSHSGVSRHVWNQKLIEVKQLNAVLRQSELADYHRKRLEMLRMTRRELRGDEAVKDDPEADIPQYVRHLDTLNYERYMYHSSAPSGQDVYNSKRGYWRYDRAFLLRMRGACKGVRPNNSVLEVHAYASPHARTNTTKLKEAKIYRHWNDIAMRVYEDLSDEQKGRFGVAKNVSWDEAERTGKTLPMVFSANLLRCGHETNRERVEEWHALKAKICDQMFESGRDLADARVALWKEHGFWAAKVEFEIVLTIWGKEFDAIPQTALKAPPPEKDLLKISDQTMEELFVEELDGYWDAEVLKDWFDECDEADMRVGELGFDNDADDGIDQYMMFRLIRGDGEEGSAGDACAIREFFRSEIAKESDEDVSADGGELGREQEIEEQRVILQSLGPEASESLKEQEAILEPLGARPGAKKAKAAVEHVKETFQKLAAKHPDQEVPRRDPEDMDAQLMGGLARHLPQEAQEVEVEIEEEDDDDEMDYEMAFETPPESLSRQLSWNDSVDGACRSEVSEDFEQVSGEGGASL